MEETNEELPNVSIGISIGILIQKAAKIKPNLKNSQVARFTNFNVGRTAAANVGRETFTGNRKDANWLLTKKVKFPCLWLFLNVLCTFVIAEQSTLSRKFLLQ